MMELSAHNIISKLPHSEDYFIVNLLSGNADLLNAEEVNDLQSISPSGNRAFVEKGYWVDRQEEKKQFRKKYLDFLEKRDNDEIQLFFVPSYSCNFSCSYCYQEGYQNADQGELYECASAFFRYVLSEFKGRKKYITLFGGEPLPGSPSSLAFMEYFTYECEHHGIDLAIVTNGYFLERYIPLFQKHRIREIQITLDGPEDVHNRRRPLKDGGPTFGAIVSGMDAALAAGITVNLRVVLDRENITSLPVLAHYAHEKGWTGSPFFKTQLGRNYELHYCQSQPSRLYSRIDLYKDLYDLLNQYPEIMEFHKPAYSVSKFLFENGELPDPLFDSCPGCKTEWAFDYTGRIYSCTATVGKMGEEVGTYYPQILLEKDKIMEWQQRDILAIESCRNCNVRLACGGGCASVALNATNHLHSPDCRPVKELLELGFSLYTKSNKDERNCCC